MLSSIVLTLGLATACLSCPTSGFHGPGAAKKAIYFLNVDPSGSSITAIEVGQSGLLMNSTSITSTGGVGLQAINVTAPDNAPPHVDPLQGQDAVVVAGDVGMNETDNDRRELIKRQYLFTINSGSDTAVMFRIDPTNALHLEMVGEPAPTLGEFAMSIAYSARYQKACVLNGGAVNGITCFSVVDKHGLVPDGMGLRKLGLDATTPPLFGGPKGSGSDIRFSPDSKKLVATFKGDTAPATLAHIFVFDVSDEGEVAAEGPDDHASPLAAIFGFVFNPSDPSLMLITDAAFGGALVKLDYGTDSVSIVHIENSTMFAGSCWAAYSPSTGMGYLIDAGAPNFGKVDLQSGDLDGFITFSTELGGAFDTVIDGTTAYFLSAVSALGVLDVASGELLQRFEYSGSERQFWTGMAMYPNGDGYRYGWYRHGGKLRMVKK